MSLRANIEHLAAAGGIEAVTVVSGGEREYRGEAAWQPVLEGALKLLDKTDETTIRVVIGAHTIVVQSEGEETVADRKSTRLNSSHLVISYAVFCLKKKKRRKQVKTTR